MTPLLTSTSRASPPRATIAPAVPPAVVDAMVAHLAYFPAEARQLAVVRLAEALQEAAEAHDPAERVRVVGVTGVALDTAIRRLEEAASTSWRRSIMRFTRTSSRKA